MPQSKGTRNTRPNLLALTVAFSLCTVNRNGITNRQLGAITGFFLALKSRHNQFQRARKIGHRSVFAVKFVPLA